MAKIATELDRALARRAVRGETGRTADRLLARGNGWAVSDVVCTSGPADRRFEEFHTGVSIAVVAAGTFQYRSPDGRALMTPGSLLLGNDGQCFECGHDHGLGDRCVSFSYAPEYFERIAADAGASGALAFRSPRLPPVRESAPLVAETCAGLLGSARVSWEELAVRLAAGAARLAVGVPARVPPVAPRNALARVTRTIRAIEHRLSSATLGLRELAAEAGLSPYHFLRTFERLTGLTPHQYVRRARLREAALRLTLESSKVIDVAFGSGFGDVSNFNRAFRAEFGLSPRAFRASASSP